MGSSDRKRSGERGFSDPIIAISSPPGRSPRGLVRVSGEGLGPAVEAVLGEVPPPRRLKACRLRLDPAEFPAAGERAPAGGSPGSPGSSRRPRGGRELPCLALYHPGPGSFTGEDVLEIQAPGHPALLERVVRVLLAACRVRLGAGRLAEAGAFTRRAYTAGRIDLTRAEGVAATIGAVSDAQLEAARQLRSGRLGAWASGLVERFAQLLALVEAGIDFVDQDDVVPITPGALDDGLAGVRAELAGMLDRSRSWSALEALPRVVLAGAPNAGKSTLFNALLGRERTVTSGVAGTTRDVIREPLRIRIDGGRAAEVMLADAAGVEDAGGAVGGAGARSPGARDSEPPEPPAPPWDGPAGVIHASMRDAARRAVEGADLVVLLDEGKGNAPAIASKAPVIRVRSKADRGAAAGGAGAGGGYDLSVSAVSGAGLDALRSRIAAALRDRAVSLAGQMLALRPRHHEELRAALAAVERARELLADQREAAALADMELIAGHMREALDRLGALGGRMTPDDVIGRVFATFCVGK